jgi:E3 ubiquitin-protein ligase HUWE1
VRLLGSSFTDLADPADAASDRLTYTPNRSSWINPEHLSLFKFIGRIIGKAIYDGRLLDAYFTRSMYKHILGRDVDYKDLESIDPEYYNSLVWMLNNDITDVIDQVFAVEADDFGQTKIIDLTPNGRDIAVTQENKLDYVKLIAEQKLTKAIQDQIDAFLGGFYEIVPKELIQLFSDSELELLISG